MTDRPRGWRSSVRGAIALFALGMTGVVALALDAVPTLREVPELASLSYPTLVLLAAANSTVLLVAFVVVGTATAPRVGLDSHVFEWASGAEPNWEAFRESLPIAVATGAALFAVVAALDVAFAPFTQVPAGESTADAEALGGLVASVPMRLLYGGITEELLLRWGVMAPLAFLLWWGRGKLGGAGSTPTAAVMWIAIVVSAVAFGVGHLPALASTIGISTALIVRTVLLNAIVGIALGWLFWRRSLETAMIAHAAFHVALVAVSGVLIWVG